TSLVSHRAAQDASLHATTQPLTLERRVPLIRLGLGGAHHERLVGVEQYQVGVEALGDIAFALQAEAERRRAAGELRHAVGREATLRALAEQPRQQVLGAAEAGLGQPDVVGVLTRDLVGRLAAGVVAADPVDVTGQHALPQVLDVLARADR